MKAFNVATFIVASLVLALSGWAVTHPQRGPMGPAGPAGLSIVGPKGDKGDPGRDGESIVGPAGPAGKDGVTTVIAKRIVVFRPAHRRPALSPSTARHPVAGNRPKFTCKEKAQ